MIPGKVLFVSFLLFNCWMGIAQVTWTERGFKDFVDGQFLDAGSNLYVSANGRIQIITRWDLNEDGFLDIILPGSQAHTEKENTYIYYNNGGDIDGRSRIEIPGGGTRDGVLADFNQDGYLDLAVANFKDSHFSQVSAWIYYGSPQGYDFNNRSELPAFQATSIAAGDFDGNGWDDLVIGCQWQEPDQPVDTPTLSLVYWNSPTGFHRQEKTELSFEKRGAHAVTVNDIDDDGVSDIIALAGDKTYLYFSSAKSLQNPEQRKILPYHGKAVACGDINGDGFQDLVIASKGEMVILKGGSDGFPTSPTQTVRVDSPVDVVLADVDRNSCQDIIVANESTPGGATWTDSYIFYCDSQAPQEMKSVPLPTLGASGVETGDLNNDGFPEVIFCNQRVINEQTLLSYVYWNRNGNFRFGDHSQLETPGVMACAVGDVNNDIYPDVIFFNDEGGFRDGATSSYIYWGDGTRNFSVTRRKTIPTHQIFGCGHADLDDDGRVDLIFSRANFISGIPHEQSGLTILWGANGEKFKNPTYLTMTTGYGGVRVADINRDGYLDMVAGGACVDLDQPDKHGFPIFWGSAKGFQHQHRTILHFEQSRIRGQLLMDLNRDGWLDIVGQVQDGKIKLWWGSESGFSDNHFDEIDLGRMDHLMYIKGADFNKDGWLDLLLPHRGPPEGAEITSFIYYGSPQGFSDKNRTEIPCYVPYQNSIADLDGDGWLDIFLTSYGGEVTGNKPSLIYWGDEQGFLKRPRMELPSYGSSGSHIADYDNDGWLDILVANHRQAFPYDRPQPHRHMIPSLLYWGGPEGFSTDQRLELEAIGPSGLNLRDFGNSYDRGLYEDYISSSYRVTRGQKPVQISWKADTPYGTSVGFQIRSANREGDLSESFWKGPTGNDSWYTESGSEVVGINGEWIQYRARLMTPNGGATPYLTEVSITFK